MEKRGEQIRKDSSRHASIELNKTKESNAYLARKALTSGMSIFMYHFVAAWLQQLAEPICKTKMDAWIRTLNLIQH